jgi:hypothetical protein
MPSMRGMRGLRGRHASDRGALAVVFMVVITLVLVPLAAYGVNSYVRNGVYGEMQRAADQGALAAAASIPLGDPSALAPILADTTLSHQAIYDRIAAQLLVGCAVDPTSPDCPTGIGVAVCTAALSPAGNLGAAYGRNPACTAAAAIRSGPIDDAINCAQSIPGVTSLLNGLLANPLLKNLVKTLLNDLTGFDLLLPALIHPTVTVTATELVKDPINPGGNGLSNASRDATARRVFKSIFPLLGTQLNERVSDAVTQFLTDLSALVARLANPSPLLPAALRNLLANLFKAGGPCASITTDFDSDLEDLVTVPDDDPTTLQDIINDAGGDQPIITLLGESQFFEFVAERVDPNTLKTVACDVNGPGAFKARLVNQ